MLAKIILSILQARDWTTRKEIALALKRPSKHLNQHDLDVLKALVDSRQVENRFQMTSAAKGVYQYRIAE